MDLATIENILEDCNIDEKYCYSAFSNTEILCSNLFNNKKVDIADFVSSKEKVKIYLRPFQNLIPKSTEVILSNLVTVFLIKDSCPHFLYIIGNNGDYFSLKAGLPVHTLPPIFTDLSVDLSTFYRVHDGWMFTLLNVGMLSINTLEIFKDPNTGTPNFLKAFQNGPDAIGFDIDSDTKQAYSLLVSLDEVIVVNDFWERIDKLLSISLDISED